MPVMNGYQVAEQAKQSHYLAAGLYSVSFLAKIAVVQWRYIAVE